MCFGSMDLEKEDFLGILAPEKKNMNNVKAIFHLKALDGDGIEADYILRLDGTAEPAGNEIFPPEVDETVLVTFPRARMTVGQGTDKVNSLCIGETAIDFSVLVKGRLTDLDLE